MKHRADEVDDLMGDEDFDVENFFGIKEENLESNAMGGINDDLMMKAIEIMTSSKPPLMPGKAPQLPDIQNKTMQNISDRIKPKSFG